MATYVSETNIVEHLQDVVAMKLTKNEDWGINYSKLEDSKLYLFIEDALSLKGKTSDIVEGALSVF